MLALARPAPAKACSCDFTGPGRFYLGEGGKLPRDATGIPYHGLNPLLDPKYAPRVVKERVELLRRVGDRDIVVPFTVIHRGSIDLIIPQGGLRAGDVYTVTVREYDRDYRFRRWGASRRERAWQRNNPPALPYSNTATVTVTGDELSLVDVTLTQSPRRRQIVDHGDMHPPGCWGTLESDTVDLTVGLPTALEPYRDYLLFETLVDGAARRDKVMRCQDIPTGRSWTKNPGTDRLFSECVDPDTGLLPPQRPGSYPLLQPVGLKPRQTYNVVVTLSTPDGARVATTPALAVTLDCAETAPEPTAAPAPAAGATPAPGPTLAVASAPDGRESPPPGLPAAASPVASPSGPPPASPPRGCTLASPDASLSLLLLLFARRRRGRLGWLQTGR